MPVLWRHEHKETVALRNSSIEIKRPQVGIYLHLLRGNPSATPRRGESLPSRESSDGGTIRGSTLLRSPLLLAGSVYVCVRVRVCVCACACFYLMWINWWEGWEDKIDKIETICHGETFREVRGSHYVESYVFSDDTPLLSNEILESVCVRVFVCVCVCVCVCVRACALQSKKDMLHTVAP